LYVCGATTCGTSTARAFLSVATWSTMSSTGLHRYFGKKPAENGEVSVSLASRSDTPAPPAQPVAAIEPASATPAATPLSDSSNASSNTVAREPGSLPPGCRISERKVDAILAPVAQPEVARNASSSDYSEQTEPEINDTALEGAAMPLRDSTIADPSAVHSSSLLTGATSAAPPLLDVNIHASTFSVPAPVPAFLPPSMTAEKNDIFPLSATQVTAPSEVGAVNASISATLPTVSNSLPEDTSVSYGAVPYTTPPTPTQTSASRMGSQVPASASMDISLDASAVEESSSTPECEHRPPTSPVIEVLDDSHIIDADAASGHDEVEEVLMDVSSQKARVTGIRIGDKWSLLSFPLLGSATINATPPSTIQHGLELDYGATSDTNTMTSVVPSNGHTMTSKCVTIDVISDRQTSTAFTAPEVPLTLLRTIPMLCQPAVASSTAPRFGVRISSGEEEEGFGVKFVDIKTRATSVAQARVAALLDEQSVEPVAVHMQSLMRTVYMSMPSCHHVSFPLFSSLLSRALIRRYCSTTTEGDNTTAGADTCEPHAVCFAMDQYTAPRLGGERRGEGRGEDSSLFFGSQHDQLWTVKYKPMMSGEVCGNVLSTKKVKHWLERWRQQYESETSEERRGEEQLADEESSDADDLVLPAHRRRSKKQVQNEYSDSDEGGAPIVKRRRRRPSLSSPESNEDTQEEASLVNCMLVVGPTGSGKTASVFACANECGYTVIEVNCAMIRDRKIIDDIVGEATQSKRLHLGSDTKPSKALFVQSMSRSNSSGSHTIESAMVKAAVDNGPKAHPKPKAGTLTSHFAKLQPVPEVIDATSPAPAGELSGKKRGRDGDKEEEMAKKGKRGKKEESPVEKAKVRTLDMMMGMKAKKPADVAPVAVVEAPIEVLDVCESPVPSKPSHAVTVTKKLEITPGINAAFNEFEIQRQQLLTGAYGVCITAPSAATSPPARKQRTLIVIKDVDVIFPTTTSPQVDDLLDRGFLAAVRDLLEDAKCPIVLIGNAFPTNAALLRPSEHAIPATTPLASSRMLVNIFNAPSADEIAWHVAAIAIAESPKSLLSAQEIVALVLQAARKCNGNLRQALQSLQFSHNHIPVVCTQPAVSVRMETAATDTLASLLCAYTAAQVATTALTGKPTDPPTAVVPSCDTSLPLLLSDKEGGEVKVEGQDSSCCVFAIPTQAAALLEKRAQDWSAPVAPAAAIIADNAPASPPVRSTETIDITTPAPATPPAPQPDAVPVPSVPEALVAPTAVVATPASTRPRRAAAIAAAARIAQSCRAAAAADIETEVETRAPVKDMVEIVSIAPATDNADDIMRAALLNDAQMMLANGNAVPTIYMCGPPAIDVVSTSKEVQEIEPFENTPPTQAAPPSTIRILPIVPPLVMSIQPPCLFPSDTDAKVRIYGAGFSQTWSIDKQVHVPLYVCIGGVACVIDEVVSECEIVVTVPAAGVRAWTHPIGGCEETESITRVSVPDKATRLVAKKVRAPAKSKAEKARSMFVDDVPDGEGFAEEEEGEQSDEENDTQIEPTPGNDVDQDTHEAKTPLGRLEVAFLDVNVDVAWDCLHEADMSPSQVDAVRRMSSTLFISHSLPGNNRMLLASTHPESVTGPDPSLAFCRRTSIKSFFPPAALSGNSKAPATVARVNSARKETGVVESNSQEILDHVALRADTASFADLLSVPRVVTSSAVKYACRVLAHTAPTPCISVLEVTPQPEDASADMSLPFIQALLPLHSTTEGSLELDAPSYLINPRVSTSSLTGHQVPFSSYNEVWFHDSSTPCLRQQLSYQSTEGERNITDANKTIAFSMGGVARKPVELLPDVDEDGQTNVRLAHSECNQAMSAGADQYLRASLQSTLSSLASRVAPCSYVSEETNEEELDSFRRRTTRSLLYTLFGRSICLTGWVNTASLSYLLPHGFAPSTRSCQSGGSVLTSLDTLDTLARLMELDNASYTRQAAIVEAAAVAEAAETVLGNRKRRGGRSNRLLPQHYKPHIIHNVGVPVEYLASFHTLWPRVFAPKHAQNPSEFPTIITADTDTNMPSIQDFAAPMPHTSDTSTGLLSGGGDDDDFAQEED
jgi:hypothetical protein